MKSTDPKIKVVTELFKDNNEQWCYTVSTTDQRMARIGPFESLFEAQVEHETSLRISYTNNEE